MSALTTPLAAEALARVKLMVLGGSLWIVTCLGPTVTIKVTICATSAREAMVKRATRSLFLIEVLLNCVEALELEAHF